MEEVKKNKFDEIVGYGNLLVIYLKDTFGF